MSREKRTQLTRQRLPIRCTLCRRILGKWRPPRGVWSHSWGERVRCYCCCCCCCCSPLWHQSRRSSRRSRWRSATLWSSCHENRIFFLISRNNFTFTVRKWTFCIYSRHRLFATRVLAIFDKCTRFFPHLHYAHRFPLSKSRYWQFSLFAICKRYSARIAH